MKRSKLNKTITIFIMTLCFTYICYSQNLFEKGYYIDNYGFKVDCLIKNLDWGENPTEFEYKLDQENNSRVLTIKSTKEFGIYNKLKFYRSKVNIDQSSEKTNELSYIKDPVFSEKEVFLKVLVEGSANLYSYKNESTKFFYSTKDSDIEQLIFKTFRTSNMQIQENKTYILQLRNNLKCQKLTLSSIESIDYNKKDLINFFVNENQCNDSEYINFEKKEKHKSLLKLNIRPGINSRSLEYNKISSSTGAVNYDVDFGNKLSFRVGAELEVFLPFRNNSFSVTLEPTFQSYKSEIDYVSQSAVITSQKITANYTTINVPVGLRYYSFLKNGSKLFYNGSVSFFNIRMKSSKIDFENGGHLDLGTDTEARIGIGYNFNEKYSFELNYQFNSPLIKRYRNYNSYFTSLSLIFGYTLF